MTVLCYHSVDPGWEHPLAVDPHGFARHCEWVSRRRQVVALRDVLPHVDRRGRLPRGAAALTFDDGFEALHAHAMPVLRRLRLPATVYLVAQTLAPGGRPVDWVDNLQGATPTTLSLDQVREMRAEGVDFQSHSFAHRNLTELGFDECVQDLRDSRELLEDLVGGPVDQLAYPRGLHDEKVRRAAETAGYRYAFALPVGAEQPGPFALPRVGVYRGNSTATVRVKCCGPYLRARTDPRLAAVLRGIRKAPRSALGLTGRG